MYVLTKLRWNYKAIHLLYDTKMMQEAGYFTKMYGIANAGASEVLFLAWKGKLPKGFARTR